MTYIVHMRSPRQTLRDLGWWGFFGLQVLFGATLSQFLLAPLLWTFWLLTLALPHPAVGLVPANMITVMAALFLVAEAINLVVGVIAVSGRKHRFLRKWVPTMPLYFPLATFAAYKGIRELLFKPFYWDKTMHGLHDTQPTATPLRRRR